MIRNVSLIYLLIFVVAAVAERRQENLEHIEAVNHFGVYILRDFSSAMEDPAIIALLKRILAGDTEKVIVLLGEYIDIPKDLKPYVMRSKHQMRKTA